MKLLFGVPRIPHFANFPPPTTKVQSGETWVQGVLRFKPLQEKLETQWLTQPSYPHQGMRLATAGETGDSTRRLWLAAGGGEFSVGDKQVLRGELTLSWRGVLNTRVFPQAHAQTTKADTVVWGCVGSTKIFKKMVFNRREKCIHLPTQLWVRCIREQNSNELRILSKW